MHVQEWTSCSKSLELLLRFLRSQLVLVVLVLTSLVSKTTIEFSSTFGVDILRLQEHLCYQCSTQKPILTFCSHNYTATAPFLRRWGWRRSVCNFLDLSLQFRYLTISFIQWSLHALHRIPHWSVLVANILSLSLQLVHVCSHHVLHLLSLSFHVGSHLFFKASLLFFLFCFQKFQLTQKEIVRKEKNVLCFVFLRSRFFLDHRFEQIGSTKISFWGIC